MSGKSTNGSYIKIHLLTPPSSPSEFWAVREDQQELIEPKKIELQNFYRNEKIVSHLKKAPKIGDLCAFREENGRWNRVEVEFVDGEEIDVRDVDTGILLTCRSIQHLRVLHSTFSSSFMAMKCRLDGVVCKSESMTWPSRAVKLFQHHLNCRHSYEAKVIGFHSGMHLVCILLPDKQDLADVLVKAGLADKMKTEDYNSLRKIIASKEISRFDMVEEFTIPAIQHSWILNDVAVSEDHWICMNHIVTPNQFWVNLLSDSIVKMEELEIEMMKTYENLPVSKFVLEKFGGLYAVKCKSKGIWRRASIIEIADDKATVIFVDYGETENISVDCLFPLDAKFKTLPLQAVCCSLDLQVKNWYRQDVLYFGALTKSSFFSIKILQKLKDRIVVDFNESSVKLDMLAFCENSRNFQKGLSQNSCDSEKDILGKYVPNNLKLEKNDTVFISFIASTSDFYVIRQKESDLCRLGKMISDLSEFCSTSRTSEERIVPGMAVASLHEGLYSRGVVKSCEGNLAHLFLVDFGKTQVVPVEEVRVIPKHLVDCLPECCIHCSLKLPNNLEDALSKSINIWFKENCESALFSVVSADRDAEKHIVDLIVEGEKESISTKLINKFINRETYSKNDLTSSPDVGSKSGINAKVDVIATKLSGMNLMVDVPKLENNCHVQVVHINSLHDFYVQKNEEVITEILHQLHVLMNNGSGSLSACTQIKVGQLVAAQFEGIWFRAVVKNIKGNEVMVSYVDYGNKEEVKKDQLRSFQDEILLGTPSMAWNCGLNGWSDKSSDASSYVEQFSKLCLNKVFLVENLRKQESSKYSLDLVDSAMSFRINDAFTNKSLISGIQVNENKNVIKAAACNVSETSTSSNVVPLQAGSSVTIVYAETPSNFYISGNTLEELTELMRKLDDYCSENVFINCLHNKGDNVAAVFEDMWYRARILDVLPNKKFKVQFSDYGNIEEVKAEDIQTIPEKIINMSPKPAIHCQLNCKDVVWNADDAVWFKDNCESNNYKVSSICLGEKKDMYSVELLDLKDGSSLSDVLMKRRNASSHVEDGRVRLKDLGSLNLNGAIRCEVILPLSPDEFWCQHLDYMISMMPHLKCSPPSGDTSYVPCLSEVCCGFHSEYSDWYRVEVKELNNNNKARVHLIDYGEEAHLAFTHLRSLPAPCSKFPPLAFKCALNDISPMPGPTWSERAIEEFSSLVVDQMVDVTVVKKEDQVSRCNLINERGITVSKELLYLKLAK